MMERVPQPVREMLALLRESGHTPYLVGGCVRDLLRGAEPDDYDMTSDARPEEVMALFGADAHPTGLMHGTVTLVRGGFAVEHTTERCDGAYRDSRHPESVRFTGSIEEDLARRDFTVNAIALSADGRLVDPFGGQADLRAGVLRCVGDPARRFGEDALRILRLLRFASVLGFSVEENTARAARERRDGLRAIAHERVCAELNKLLCGEHAAAVLLEYPDILGVVLPEILPCVGFDQRNPHHCYDVWEHTARAVGAAPPTRVLRWTMLLHDLGKPKCFTQDANGIGHFYGHTAVSAEMAEEIMARFADKKGGCFKTADDAEKLIKRPKEVFDGALPSGNSAAAALFDLLWRMTGEEKWRAALDSQLRFLCSRSENYPAGCAFGLTALLSLVYPTKELLCVAEEPPESLDALMGRYAPELTLLFKRPGGPEAAALAAFAPFTENIGMKDGKPSFYLCANGACGLPFNI